jgi:hypothetical protein
MRTALVYFNSQSDRVGLMQDLERALTDISAIREQLAQSTEFRGYAPPTLAITGVAAFLVAAAQALWLPESSTHMSQFVAVWAGTAAISVVLIAIETVNHSRRAHGGFAAAMLQSALEQFLPAVVAGGLVTAAMLELAPQELWLLPGLWHFFFALGVFSSCRFLPRATFLVGVWYLACGLACLALAAPTHTNSPWAMGIPYGIGHLLVAAIVHHRRQLERAQ